MGKKRKDKSSSSSSSSSSGEVKKEEAPQEHPAERLREAGASNPAASSSAPATRRTNADERQERRGGRADDRDSKSKPEAKDEGIEEYRKRKISNVETLESLGRGGGVYIPPFKLARMQKDIEDKTSPEFQRQAWEALRKSINGLVNKVNVGNIKNLVVELLQENLVRGRGLFVRALVRAQMASPGFTHVFSALVSVINSKLPEVGDLVIRRVILQFRRAYKRNDKIVTTAAIKFMAHLVNQKVASELLALHVATLLLERVTDDSIEVCVSLMQECGKAMEELTPAGCVAIYERLRTILQEGQIDKRVQYVIEGLFSVRRKKYEEFLDISEGLDLVGEDDQVTHEVDLLDDTITGEETLNIFKAQRPEEYAADEARWKSISAEILGLEDDEDSDSSDDSEEEAEQRADDQATQKILDFSEKDLVNLRRSIYLVIMSSLHFEECVHKILKLNITEGQEKEVCTMLIDCCAMDKMFNRFFALQSQRLCELQPVYQERFAELFDQQYQSVHRLETNKLRNIGKFFSHLLYTDALSWNILANVRITEETTTSSSRIFIKVICQELCEQWGIKKLMKRMQDPEYQEHIGGLFPKDSAKNMRFAINFYTAIGLGMLTEDMRAALEKAPTQKQEEALAEASTDISSDDSDSDSSSSSSSSDSSSSS